MKTSNAFLLAAILSFLAFIFSLLSFLDTHRGLTLTAGLISLALALYLGVRFYDGRAR